MDTTQKSFNIINVDNSLPHNCSVKW